MRTASLVTIVVLAAPAALAGQQERVTHRECLHGVYRHTPAYRVALGQNLARRAGIGNRLTPP